MCPRLVYDMFYMRSASSHTNPQCTYLTKRRRGSNSCDRSATRAIVVLSPPGMIKASQRASCSGVRTSSQLHSVFSSFSALKALRSSCRCSLNAPCNARTPTLSRRPTSAISCSDFVMKIRRHTLDPVSRRVTLCEQAHPAMTSTSKFSPIKV